MFENYFDGELSCFSIQGEVGVRAGMRAFRPEYEFTEWIKIG